MRVFHICNVEGVATRPPGCPAPRVVPGFEARRRQGSGARVAVHETTDPDGDGRASGGRASGRRSTRWPRPRAVARPAVRLDERAGRAQRVVRQAHARGGDRTRSLAPRRCRVDGGELLAEGRCERHADVARANDCDTSPARAGSGDSSTSRPPLGSTRVHECVIQETPKLSASGQSAAITAWLASPWRRRALDVGLSLAGWPRPYPVSHLVASDAGLVGGPVGLASAERGHRVHSANLSPRRGGNGVSA